MDKKTYIYDTSKGFSSFIKHYYSSKMCIDSCTNKKKFVFNFLIKYDICFFIVNDMDDFFNLTKICHTFECVFIGSPSKIFNQKIVDLNYENSTILNFNDNKSDILKIIDFNMKKTVGIK